LASIWPARWLSIASVSSPRREVGVERAGNPARRTSLVGPHLPDRFEHLPHPVHVEVARPGEQFAFRREEGRRREPAHVVPLAHSRMAVDVDANRNEPLVDVGGDPRLRVGDRVHLVTALTPRG